MIGAAIFLVLTGLIAVLRIGSLHRGVQPVGSQVIIRLFGVEMLASLLDFPVVALLAAFLVILLNALLFHAEMEWRAAQRNR